MRESVAIGRIVRFGVFELDVRSGELRKAGVRLNLPHQPLQILVALLERPGELVTRDELRHRLWSSETFVDFEHGVNAAIKRLREALGDSAETPRFVETLPRRGLPVHRARCR
jgi:DNA-binding winged helix-turn-helix (wHTH) protein